MTYDSVIQFIRENKQHELDKMRYALANQFMARINNDNFVQDTELLNLKVEECALSRIDELLETLLEKIERGETTNG